MSCSDKYDVVRKTQVALFKDSGVNPQDFDGLIDLFGPEPLAEFLGLKYCEVEVIPSNDAGFEVAGTLDRTNRTVTISRRFPLEQRRLTGIHEIVHWMLHKHVGADILHRDRPISQLPQKKDVEWYEWEATNVACQYLMTERMVKERFGLIFGLPDGVAIEFDDHVAFHLNENLETFRRMDVRQRAIRLATATFFGRSIIPLHYQFKVSPTAMAIRLQELNLLAPDRWRGKPKLHLVR